VCYDFTSVTVYISCSLYTQLKICWNSYTSFVQFNETKQFYDAEPVTTQKEISKALQNDSTLLTQSWSQLSLSLTKVFSWNSHFHSTHFSAAGNI